MKRLCLGFVCSFLIQRVIGSCGSTRIISQADADVLSSCPTITGNVVLATNAVGSIKLEGVVSIEGNLTSEQCDAVGQSDQLGYLPGDPYIYSAYISKNCTGLLSLSSSTLVSVSQNVSLQGLLNITNIAFPLLKSVGTDLYLDGLPALTTFSSPNLSSIEGLHLAYAQNLSTIGITTITNISSIEINDVGLTEIPSIDVASITYLAIGGIPNIHQMIVTTASIGTLQVNGNGFLDLSLYDTEGTAAIKTLDTLSISGCSALHADSSVAINTLIAVGNSFLDLNLFDANVTNIYLQNNAQVRSLEWSNSFTSLGNVVITGNPLLTQVQWTMRNVTSIILEGAFGMNSLASLGSYLLGVTAQFSLQSSDTAVNCSTFNNLRSSGDYQGVYSCQGTTVVANSAASTSRVSIFAMSSIVFAGLLCS